jgi:ATP-dependent DNA helicase PIF1
MPLHLGGPATIYTVQDSLPDGDGATYPQEYLNSLEPTSLPVILLRNMDPKNALYNGARLIVRELGKKSFIGAEIIVGRHNGEQVIIPRIPLDTTQDGSSPVMFRRRQVPRPKPAFAMTINKAQGQTLRHVGLYLPQPVFDPWVALCCLITLHGSGSSSNDGAIQGKLGIYTRNVVYRGVLTEKVITFLDTTHRVLSAGYD